LPVLLPWAGFRPRPCVASEWPRASLGGSAF